MVDYRTMLSHGELVRFAKVIMEELAQQPFVEPDSSVVQNGGLIPDLISADGRIAVECGYLNVNNSLKTKDDRIEMMVRTYDEAWWIPFPKLYNGFPIFSVIRFKVNPLDPQRLRQKTAELDIAIQEVTKLKEDFISMLNSKTTERLCRITKNIKDRGAGKPTPEQKKQELDES